jgi:hypothetical protein
MSRYDIMCSSFSEREYKNIDSKLKKSIAGDILGVPIPKEITKPTGKQKAKKTFIPHYSDKERAMFGYDKIDPDFGFAGYRDGMIFRYRDPQEW